MWYQRNAKNKYRAVSSSYNGILYHSKAEAAYAAELDLRLKAKDILSWERQIRCPIDVNGFHICDYIVDFKINHKDDTEEFVEIKGFPTEVFRLKRKLFEATFIHNNQLKCKYTVVNV